MDADLRILERRALADPTDQATWEQWRTALARARTKKPLRDLEKRLDALAKRISQTSRRHPYPNSQDTDGPHTSAGELRRRWRRLYREWLRRSGNWAKREVWLTPQPPCVCSGAAEAKAAGKGFVHMVGCGSHGSIVLIQGDHEWRRSEALKTREWIENSRFIDRGRKRREKLKGKNTVVAGSPGGGAS